MSELGVSFASDNNIVELKKRAEKIKGISGDNNMETFILQISRLENNIDSFSSLGWRILSKPTKNWIDPDVDRLFVEATKLAREFNSLETMASIKGNTQSKFAFSLLTHSKMDESRSKSESFELSEKEISRASELVERIKTLKHGTDTTPSKKELLAALTFIINEGDD